MRYGICMLAAVAVRETPSTKSQMVSQLLFGELMVLNDTKDDWFLIETVDDWYSGWVRRNQVKKLTESEFAELNDSERFYLQTLSAQVRAKDAIIPVFRGAQFHGWEEGAFTVAGESFYYKKAVHKVPAEVGSREILSVAANYLSVPYLWGGRSPMGIDGSGLVQMAYKMNGIMLPRDAIQQVEKGEQILFVEAAEPGDLAFFENKEGSINHVGLILGNNKILHAWGKVRIDNIDHQGIFNKEAGRYTHHLRVVKRIINR